MRIAFYAPLKSPEHEVPSGDRRVARLLFDALCQAGHHVDLVSNFRSYDAVGDPQRQSALREEGNALAEGLVSGWLRGPVNMRPELWFTYHVYYKAPDWLGPRVSAALGVPYVVSEASHAPKREGGPWAVGHAATTAAISAASLVLCPTRDDMACLEGLVSPPGKIQFLPPFLDPSPYRTAALGREAHRAELAFDFHLDPSVPWIVVAAMMRPGDKLASYRMLAGALRSLMDLDWHLVIAGDGTGRSEVEHCIEAAVPGRARFLGERSAEELAKIYAACDLSVWPAVNEAYGMAMLEAQAAGVPVVSRSQRGVPDVVSDGRTGLLATADEDRALSELTRTLLTDETRRKRLGQEAARYVATERSIDSAAHKLSLLLDGIGKFGADVGEREVAR